MKKNTGLDWWYLDDEWVLSFRFLPHIIQKSPTYHLDEVWLISSRYHPDIIHILHTSSKYHPWSPTYHPNMTQLIFFTTPQLEKLSFNPDMARLLQKKTTLWNLKLNFSSSRYYPNIIQISSRNHSEIIQKSSRNHPEII